MFCTLQFFFCTNAECCSHKRTSLWHRTKPKLSMKSPPHWQTRADTHIFHILSDRRLHTQAVMTHLAKISCWTKGQLFIWFLNVPIPDCISLGITDKIEPEAKLQDLLICWKTDYLNNNKRKKLPQKSNCRPPVYENTFTKRVHAPVSKETSTLKTDERTRVEFKDCSPLLPFSVTPSKKKKKRKK